MITMEELLLEELEEPEELELLVAPLPPKASLEELELLLEADGAVTGPEEAEVELLEAPSLITLTEQRTQQMVSTAKISTIKRRRLFCSGVRPRPRAGSPRGPKGSVSGSGWVSGSCAVMPELGRRSLVR